MTRIIQFGAETGDTQQEGADTTNLGTVAANVQVVSSSPTPRSGNYCLKTSPNVTNGTAFARKRFGHVSLGEVWYAFGMYAHIVSEPATTTFVFRNFDDAGAINILMLYDGVLRLYYYTTGTPPTSTFTNAVIIGATSMALSQDAWHLVEIQHIPHISNGTLRVYVDGTLGLEAVGVRTSNTMNVNHDFDVGFHRCSSTAGNAGSFMAFDDIRINSVSGTRNNGRPGDGKILPLLVTAAGAYTQLTPSAGSNFQCVDEVPPSASDFVSQNTVGLKDSYALSDLATTGNIQAVSHMVLAQNSDGGGGSVGFLTRSGGVDAESSPQAITASWTYYRNITEVDPSDSNPWTTAKLNALEAGLVVR